VENAFLTNSVWIWASTQSTRQHAFLSSSMTFCDIFAQAYTNKNLETFWKRAGDQHL